MKVKGKSVVVLSGGLDSTTLLYDQVFISSKENVNAVSFNYGQKHKKELSMAVKTCNKLGITHKIINIPELAELTHSSLTTKTIPVPEGHYKEETMKSTVVPNRNMILLSFATAYAIGIEAKDLFYGAHAGDHDIYPDCRPEFVSALREAIKLCDWSDVYLWAPYINMTKSEIVREGLRLGVDYSSTWTCYKGEELACGKCGSCSERLEAFEKNGKRDPIKYLME